MMRRPLAYRLLGLFLAVAYFASPGVVQAGRVCPHHDATPEAEHAGAIAGHTGHAHDGAVQTGAAAEQDGEHTGGCRRAH